MSDQHDILTQADFAWLHKRLSSVAEHRDKCTKAIASIGGDPATVGELVEALKNLHAMVLGEFPSLLEDNCTGDSVYRVLAKLPENSNED